MCTEEERKTFATAQVLFVPRERVVGECMSNSPMAGSMSCSWF